MQISITILILTLYVIYILDTELHDTQDHSETAHITKLSMLPYIYTKINNGIIRI